MAKGLLLLPSLLCVLTLSAQPEPIKWGKIPDEHLQMTDFPADTNAAAVILADYGTVYFQNGRAPVFERHRRIKILKESGYDWGTFSITYYAKDRIEDVRRIKGQTFTVGPNGKVTRHKMDKKSIFKEEITDEYHRVKFTLPALEPGAVIEYSYKVYGDNPTVMPSWRFQTSEPVLWSEFRAEIPSMFSYVRATKGVLAFAEESSEQLNRPYGRAMAYRWAMRDVEALREERFMTTPKDYRASIEFQLASFFDGYREEKFLSTWEALADELVESPSFGRRLDKGRLVRDEVEAVTAGLETEKEKMIALYDYVRSTINWNGEMGFMMNQDLKDVLKKKDGDGPGIALLLVAMLREAGLEADPVLISTRDHGRVQPLYPLWSQFNDVIVHARADGKTYLLDATNPLRPYNLLPFRSLNGSGWLVRKGNPEWISVQAAAKHRHQASIQASLSADGTLEGTFLGSDADYSAYFKRVNLKDADAPEDFIREHLFDNLDGLEITAHEVENEEVSAELLRTSADFRVPAYAQAAGDFIYLNPMVVDREDENPLRLPKRTFPVDLGYARDAMYTLALELPEGYEVHELPPNRRVQMPGGGAVFQRFFKVDENGTLQVQARFALSKAIFEPRDYANLRKFYEEVVAAHAEQIVLRRAPEVPAAEAAPPTEGAEPSGDR